MTSVQALSKAMDAEQDKEQGWGARKKSLPGAAFSLQTLCDRVLLGGLEYGLFHSAQVALGLGLGLGPLPLRAGGTRARARVRARARASSTPRRLSRSPSCTAH